MMSLLFSVSNFEFSAISLFLKTNIMIERDKKRDIKENAWNENRSIKLKGLNRITIKIQDRTKIIGFKRFKRAFSKR